MFAKKFLSIVSLLFIGSHIASTVAQATANACSFSSICTNPVSSCAEHEKNMYFVIKNDDDAVTTEGTDLDASDYTIVRVSGDGLSCDASITGNGIYMSVSNSDTKTYIKKTDSGISIVEAVDSGSCADGKLTTDGKLCVGANARSLVLGNDYLVTNTYGAFDADATKKFALKFADNALKVNEEYNGNTIYCVDGATDVIEDRRTNFCSSSVACSGYCKCTSGECDVLEDGDFTKDTRQSPATCDPKGTEDQVKACDGYYILKTDDTDSLIAGASEVADTNVFYDCTAAESCTPVVVASTKGYLPNSDASSNAAVPFIKCNGTSCVAVKASDITDTDCTSTDTVATAGDLIKVTNGGANTITYSICLTKGTGAKSAELAVFTSGTVTSYGGSSSAIQYLLDSTAKSACNPNAIANHFVVVDVLKGSVKLAAKATEYRYKYTDADLKVYGRSDESKNASICTAGKTIYEYIFDDFDDTEGAKTQSTNYQYYTLNDSEQWK